MTTGKSSDRTLSLRALNRAMLERQLLLRRSTKSPARVIEHLVGMQAQMPNTPYVGLWSRIEDFELEDLAKLYRERKVVRIALMRSTIHLVTSRDCLSLRPVVQAVIDRSLRGGYGRHLVAIDTSELANAARALLEERPMTLGELSKRLGWPGHNRQMIVNAVRALIPLVQIPPRGIWGQSSTSVHAPADWWLPDVTAREATSASLILRYLKAFGPATVRDVQAWSGITGLGETVASLREKLRTFRDETGRELLDVRAAPLPDPDAPAPVRFLPEFDNVLLAYADRSRVISERHRKRIYPPNGLIAATVLVDGFARATWKVIRERRNAVLAIDLLEPLSRDERTAVAEEGERLLEFVAADTDVRDVRITRAGSTRSKL